MRVIILKDHKMASEWVSTYIEKKIIQSSKKFILGLPTGSTPIQVYENFIKNKTDFSNVTTFNMDEYVNLPPEHEQSYHYFMNKYLFNHINIPKQNINIPNGNAKDLDKECVEYENKIINSGGIDLFLCGIGSDGHLAFNEPGSSFSSLTRIKTLNQETITDNSRFFDDINMVPTTALTVGLKTVMDSKEIILLANGIGKAKAIMEAVEGNVSTTYPCSIVQNHPKATIVIDEMAANELTYKTYKYYMNLQKKTDIFGKMISNNILANIKPTDNILITSPHPDDDVIGMGGLMNNLPNKSRVKILYMTSGAGGMRKEDDYGKYTRIKEGISAVKILGYEKSQVIYRDFPFYTNSDRTISKKDSSVFNSILKETAPDHIFVCSDPDPRKTHIKCMNIIKNSKIKKNTIIWLYKSAWETWNDSSIKSNIDVCIDEESFNLKLQAIDMHISQINPPVTMEEKLYSFKDIVKRKNKSWKYFGQYIEKFHLMSSEDFKMN